MDKPLVLVLRDRYQKGIDHLGEHEGGREHGTALPIDEACAQGWDSDAHCLPIFPATPVADGYPRINAPALSAIRAAGGELLMGSFWYDLDNSPHLEHDDTTFEEMILQIDQLPAHLKPSIWFTTRKGARLVYVLDKPLPVDEAERAHRGWAEVLRAARVPLDPECHSNWTRIYRLPRVLREGDYTGNHEFFRYCENWELPPLKSADIPRRGSSVGVLAHTPLGESWDGPRPTTDQAEAVLGSEFFKQARSVLMHRACGPVIFEFQPLPVGSRDNLLFGMVKQAFKELYASKLRELATPPRVYGLFFKAVEQLDPDRDTPDWLQNLWLKCCREWRLCVAEAAQVADAAIAENAPAAVESTLIEELHRTYPQDVPQDEFGATLWAQRHTIAVVGTRHYFVLQEDGSYSSFCCSSDQLVPTLRATGAEKRIETHRLANGEKVRRRIHELIEDYGTAVVGVRMSLHCDQGYIENIDSLRAVLVLPAFKLQDWVGVHSAEVDRWLRLLAGKDYELLEQWIVRALAFRQGPICALVMTGPPSVGKKLLVRGLAECIVGGALATGLEFEAYQSDAILQTCFLSFDEGLPDVGNMSETFRRYVGGEEIKINRKYKPVVSICNPLRVIATCNYAEVLEKFAGSRQLGLQDQEALAMRLLHIPAQQAAADYLAVKGGPGFTARNGNRWIRGDAGQESDHVVAKHFLWLYQNRPRHQLGKRLLMEGNVQEMLMKEMRTRGGVAPEVLETIAWMVESNDFNVPIAIDKWGIWVTSKGVCDAYHTHFRNRGPRLNTKNVGQVLDGICYPATNNAVWREMRNKSSLKGRWRLVKAEELLDYAFEVGLPNNKLQEIAQLEMPVKKRKNGGRK